MSRWTLGLALATAYAPQEPEADQPNVLLIVADDLGVEGLGCFGGSRYSTPHLDSLAATGVRFSNAHAIPLCTPSRIELLTGRSNVRCYTGFGILPSGASTFVGAFKAAGYRTAAAGKWQLWGPRDRAQQAGLGTHPREVGFHRWCLWQVDAIGNRYWNPTLDRDGKESVGPKDVYGPDAFRGFLQEFIAADDPRPFLAYYPMVLPHAPFKRTPLQAVGNTSTSGSQFVQMVSYMDLCVGRLIQTLDDLGLRENTLIVFVGDNGSPVQTEGVLRGAPYPGGKGQTHAAGTHVPLIVSWTGRVPAGKVCDDLVGLVDIYPTLADATGILGPEQADGRSFWPQAQGETGLPRDWLYGYFNPRPGGQKYEEQRWVLGHRFKLYGDGRLYDIERDPGEKSPLDLDDPEDFDTTAREATAQLQAALDSMPRTLAKKK